MGIRGAIFDLDGTVFNSVETTSSLLSRVLSDFLGRQVPPIEAVRILGKSPEEIGEHFGLSGEKKALFKKTLPERFLAEIKRFPLFPGTVETLDLLSKNKVRIGAVSGAPERNMRIFLERSGIIGNFLSIKSAEDFPGGKMSGAPFKSACEELGVLPEETICLGDAPIDAIGARRAGCIPLGVLSGSGKKAELEELAETIDSISELPHYLRRKGFI